MFHYATRKTDGSWEYIGPFFDIAAAWTAMRQNDYSFVASVPEPLPSDMGTIHSPTAH